MRSFALTQISLILGLALASGYQVPDLSQANWSTVLFLTPAGIVQNYLEKNSSVLWSFYSDISSGQSFSLGQGLLMTGLYLGLMISAWIFLRKPEHRE